MFNILEFTVSSVSLTDETGYWCKEISAASLNFEMADDIATICGRASNHYLRDWATETLEKEGMEAALELVKGKPEWCFPVPETVIARASSFSSGSLF